MSRKSFLRSALTVVAGGAAITAFTAESANAAPVKTTCCRSTASSCPNCPGPTVKYLCNSGCTEATYCVCHSDVGSNCYSFNCA
ncbi:MAG: hypothetical protein JWO76_2758 [Nocardioides sp.]|nr:hypothetical protein [Nocardioides sp.]